MSAKTRKTAEITAENAEVENPSTEAEKAQETAHTKATKGRFIYIGPTMNTGLVMNTIFDGTREEVEEYLKDTLEKIPQVKLLIVATENLAECKAKVNRTGTILNKYFNDILSLSRKEKEK